MSVASFPNTVAGWRELAYAAVQYREAIPAEELMLVRDQTTGQRYRPLGPPPEKVARIGSVLLLLYPEGDDLVLPLTVRSELLNSHRGEVSLPGGSSDPCDADASATAFRECEEEIGVPAAGLTLWGPLASIYIHPSNFQITPVVAYSEQPPVFRVNPAEVGGLISVSLRALLDPATTVVEHWTLRGVEVEVPFFAVAQQKVWGATALILSEFAARMRRLLVQ